jgi:uncharacterized protein
MTSTVTDNPDEHRLETHENGQLAELIYRARGDRLILVHTEVPDALGGRGIGGQLVRAAIDKAAHDRMTLVPLCPFARGWLQRHPAEAGKVPIDWGAPPAS